jgi:hypothetical protein
MSLFPPCLDASIGGAIASAALAVAPPCTAPEAPQARFDLVAPTPAPLPAPQAPRGWRKALGGLVDLVSGPEPVRA